MTRLKVWWNGLLDVFFPRSCLDCGKPVDGDGFLYLCQSCGRRVVYAGPPCCQSCGYPIYGEIESARTCPHCLHLEPAYEAGRVATLFQGPVRSLIHALKYEQAEYVVEDLARLAKQSPEFLNFLRGAVLVPVPLHPRKLRERGYNQSDLIAGALCRAAQGGTRRLRLLERVLDTPSQTHFSRRERQANLKNAFALVNDASIMEHQRYVIIDDVFTTGSTLNACAQVLRRSGVRRIGIATIGHG